MIRCILAGLACLALAGCAAPAAQPALTQAPTSTSSPAGGVALRGLGFRNAPADLYAPGGSSVAVVVDQTNNIVATFTEPDADALLAWWRSVLPPQGWTITADGGDSLLFERGDLRGAFTVTGDLAALTIRSDDVS